MFDQDRMVVIYRDNNIITIGGPMSSNHMSNHMTVQYYVLFNYDTCLWCLLIMYPCLHMDVAVTVTDTVTVTDIDSTQPLCSHSYSSPSSVH